MRVSEAARDWKETPTMPTRRPKPGEANVHVILDAELWAGIRRRAIDEGRRAVDLVRDALADYLKRAPKRKAKP